MTEVNLKRPYLSFGLAAAFAAAYVGLRAAHVLPSMLFPKTVKLESVDLLGGVLLAPSLFFLCRGLARTSDLVFIDRLKRLLASLNERFFVAAAMLFCLGASLALSVLVLGAIPHVQDSIVLMFQAKIFAMGKVGVPPPAHPEFFPYPFQIVENGLLHAKYLPMHSLIHALGLLLNVTVWVEPITGAVTLLVIYLLARELYGQLTAKATALLVSLSPFFLYMHTSFLSHTTSLLFFSLCLLSLVKVIKKGSLPYAALCGLSWGLMFNTRPQTAYVLGLALLPIALKSAWQSRRRVLTVGAFALGLSPAVALTLAYRFPFTGKLLSMPFDFSNPTDRLGFHDNVGDLYGSFGHTPLKAWYNFAKNFVEMNSNVFGFPMASLLFFFVVVFALKKDRWERAFIALPAALVFFHIFYWVDGVCFGARYYFACLPAFAILTIRGVRRFGSLLSPGERGFRAAVVMLLLLVGVSLADYHPRRARLHANNYWSVNTKVADAVERMDIHNAVIFMQTEDDPLSYSAGYQHDSPTFDDDVLYARHLGRTRDRLLFDDYPGRAFFICTYGTTSEREPLFELIHPLPTERTASQDVAGILDRAFYLASMQRLEESSRTFSWAILYDPESTIGFLPLDDEFFVDNLLPRIELYQPEAYLFIGLRLFDLGRIDMARNAIESAVRMSPVSVCPQLPLEDPFFRTEILDRLDVRGEDSLLSLAQACYYSSQYERALRYIERALDVGGETADVLLRLGQAALRAGRPDRALRSFNRALELCPGDAGALIGIARTQIAAGNLASAEAAIRRALGARPAGADLWVTMGDYALAQGDMEKASRAFQIALAHDERNIEAGIKYAQFLLTEGKVEDALKLLRRIGPWVPRGRELNLLLGICHYLRNEPPLAFLHLIRARGLSDEARLAWESLPVLASSPLASKVFASIESMMEQVK